MKIRDKLGNECELRKKVQSVGSIRVVIGKKTPDGKPSNFWHGYEESTGHWVGIGSTEEECLKRINDCMPSIERTAKKIGINTGGLFG